MYRQNCRGARIYPNSQEIPLRDSDDERKLGRTCWGNAAPVYYGHSRDQGKTQDAGRRLKGNVRHPTWSRLAVQGSCRWGLSSKYLPPTCFFVGPWLFIEGLFFRSRLTTQFNTEDFCQISGNSQSPSRNLQ